MTSVLPPLPRRRREAGFTLIELLVVTVVAVILILIALRSFDGLNRLARVQVNLTDLQQQQRVAQRELVRVLRMAGRGGLNGDPVTAAGVDRTVGRLTAIEVRNNVGVGSNPAVEPVAGESAQAVPGSDILVVRGVFSSPVYQVNYVSPTDYVRGTPQVVIRDTTPTGIPQDLTALRDAISNDRAEALIFTDALGDAYGVAELDPANSSSAADSVTLAFRTTGGTHAAVYSTLSSGGSFPDFRKVLTVGILEEYRYYVEDGDPARHLACARVYPATDAVHEDGALESLVAADIYDLQVALGFDSNQGGGFLSCDADVAGADDDIVEATGGQNDDWLFNAASGDGEDVTAAPWTEPPGGWASTTGCADTVQPRLFFVRVSTLARSPRADAYYEAPPLASLEDRAYEVSATDPLNGDTGRRFRRRILQTTVDLRNL
jgi:prepilin-type N-terminal cleavage/methylation domain-containing protein